MKRFSILCLLCLTIGASNASAQGWLKELGKKAEEVAKRKVEEKVQQRTEQVVDDILEGKAVKGKKKEKAQDEAKAEEEAQAQAQQTETTKKPKQEAAMSWNKFDFVAGDEIIFEDNLDGEQLGEFPSQWDLLYGSAEVAEVAGSKAIELQNQGSIIPLMTEKSYLPEKFTVEMDFFYRDSYVNHDEKYAGDWVNTTTFLALLDAEDEKMFEIHITPQTRSWGDSYDSYPQKFFYEWRIGEDSRNGETQEINLTTEAWHHVAISFNQRALKLYLDETRVINIPNMNAPAKMRLSTYSNAEKLYFVKNIRIAKGAVPLYDRMATEGKFITYGITFDTGKSNIKPESMGELNRIVKMMTEKPELKFSVEGHTDNTGTEEANQKLSEARAKAIVDKLVEMGIDSGRLSAVGKGQGNPIADNATAEGRAKNRRVEFVKQ